MANDFTYNLKKWASQVAQSVHDTDDPSQALTDSMIKVSQSEDLNSDQVERLCEQSNYDVYVDCYRQNPESVYTGIIYNSDHSLWSQYISCFKDYCFCVSKSYTVSTGLDFGHPDRMVLNVDRSIDVTVMGCVALWTSPLSYREWQVIHHIPASRTCFARWEEGVQWDHIPAIPVCFVGQLSYELEPATVPNSSCQCLILHHIFNTQVLCAYGLVFADKAVGEFVQEILTGISYACVNTGHLLSEVMAK